MFLTCSKKRTIFGSTSCNAVSRFLKEIPKELLDGYEEAFGDNENNSFKDTNYTFPPYRNHSAQKEKNYTWTYGNNNGNVKTFKINQEEPVAVAASNKTGYNFRTAESFLSSLTKSNKNHNCDLSKYKEGQRVFHKKFGEGTISIIEPEGEDLKVDINFDKVGHKRLMAKYAGLEVIE